MDYQPPFFLPGGPTGALLIHGFTSTPLDMKWLGEHLNQHGYTAHCPRLAGHATNLADLNRSTWREWYFSVLDGYSLLRSQCERVGIVGYSMGGALGFILAAKQPVDGLVTLGTPHKVDSAIKPLLPILSKVIKTAPKTHLLPLDEDPIRARVLALQAERGEPEIGLPVYRVWPLPAMTEVIKMLRVMRRLLPEVKVPALLMHGKLDKTVPFNNLARNYAAIGSQDKRMREFVNSGHVLLVDAERDTVHQEIVDFIEQLAEMPHAH